MLGRADYRQIAAKKTSIFRKEENVCKLCTLYPKDFDFKKAPAGIATSLCQKILSESYLDIEGNPLDRAVDYFRASFDEDKDKKVDTLIHHAFPEFSLKEIASWDVLKTADYMVRSEFLNQIDEKKTESGQPGKEQKEAPEIKFKLPFQPVKDKKATTLTPEMLHVLQERYPDIDWAHDSVMMHGMKAFDVENVDDRAVAERPIDGSEDGQNAIPKALRNRFKVITAET